MIEVNYSDVLIIAYRQENETLQITFKMANGGTSVETFSVKESTANELIHNFRVLQGLAVPEWYENGGCACGGNCGCDDNRQVLHG